MKNSRNLLLAACTCNKILESLVKAAFDDRMKYTTTYIKKRKKKNSKYRFCITILQVSQWTIGGNFLILILMSL